MEKGIWGSQEEIGVWNAQGGRKDKCLFFLYIQQKILKCSTWMQSQKQQNDLCLQG